MTQLFLKIYDALSRHRPWVAGVTCALALLCAVLPAMRRAGSPHGL